MKQFQGGLRNNKKAQLPLTTSATLAEASRGFCMMSSAFVLYLPKHICLEDQKCACMVYPLKSYNTLWDNKN